MSDVTHMNESRHTYECVTPHIWMGHATRMNASCLAYMDESCHIFKLVTSHIWMSCVTRTHETCHTHGWVMSHIWRSDGTGVNELGHTYEWVVSHIWTCHITHMGWLRLVGSLKLCISVENIGLCYRALLQKRPIILKSLLAEATP